MPDRRLAPAARRAHLLDTAVRLAAGGDLLAVSVADIAEAAGVSEGLLYHYFPSKQALLEAAVQRAADQLLADLTAAIAAPAAPAVAAPAPDIPDIPDIADIADIPAPGAPAPASASVAVAVAAGPPMARLAAALDAYLDHVQADPTGWRALLAATSGEPARIVDALEAATRELIYRALGIERPSAALAMVLTSWSALERTACLSLLASPPVPRDAVRDLLLASFGSALAATAPHDAQVRDIMARLSEDGSGS